MCFSNRIETLDIARAIQYLREPDPDLQVLGAAYIQHECYNDSDAKNEVRWTDEPRGLELLRQIDLEHILEEFEPQTFILPPSCWK